MKMLCLISILILLGWRPECCLAQGLPEAQVRSLKDILVPSLFPNFPPYIKFQGPADPPASLPKSLRKSLIWRGRRIPRDNLVRTVVENTGFKWESRDFKGTWIAHWGSQRDLTEVERGRLEVMPYQKWNHFMESGELSNKDRMWNNFREAFPTDPLLNIPPTFILPAQLQEFREAWERTQNKVWIEKIALGTHGFGIRLVNHWNEINGTDSERRVVQKYIENLLLVNGSRTVVRIHAVVTSYNPLRLYVYRNMMVFLNYISFEYGPDDPCRYNGEACGAKLWDGPQVEQYLKSINRTIDMSSFWAQMDDITVKVVLGAADKIGQASRKDFRSAYNAYEILGIDVAVDQNFVPYLLEVNTDMELGGNPEYMGQGVVSEAFTLAGFHLPPYLDPVLKENIKKVLKTEADPTYPEVLYRPRASNTMSSKQRNCPSLKDYEQEATETLSPDDICLLIIAEDELRRAVWYRRIFPSESSRKYLDKLPESSQYYNKLYADWEERYGEDRSAGIDRLRQLAPKCLAKPLH